LIDFRVSSSVPVQGDMPGFR